MEEAGDDAWSVVLRRVSTGSSSSVELTVEETKAFAMLSGWYKSRKRALGDGFSGVVRLAEHKATGARVAVKVVRKRSLEEYGLQMTELDVLRRVDHPFIARLLYERELDDSFVLVSEFCPHGELFDLVMNAPPSGLEHSLIQRIMGQLLQAVEYLHAIGWCHRDLKLENVMIRGTRVKLIDFGFAARCETPLGNMCGSPEYSAPELFISESYMGKPADIWSLGVMTYMLVTGFVPFGDPEATCSGTWVWPEEVADLLPSPQTLAEFLDQIFVEDPTQRPSASDLLNSPWLRDEQLIDVPPATAIDEDILQRMEQMGMPSQDVRASVITRVRDELFAYYHMLLDQKQRQDEGDIML